MSTLTILVAGSSHTQVMQLALSLIDDYEASWSDDGSATHSTSRGNGIAHWHEVPGGTPEEDMDTDEPPMLP